MNMGGHKAGCIRQVNSDRAFDKILSHLNTVRCGEFSHSTIHGYANFEMNFVVHIIRKLLLYMRQISSKFMEVFLPKLIHSVRLCSFILSIPLDSNCSSTVPSGLAVTASFVWNLFLCCGFSCKTDNLRGVLGFLHKR